MSDVPKCLHCVIADAINAHARAHNGGNVILNEAIGNIAEVTAELLSLANRQHRRAIRREFDALVDKQIVVHTSRPGHQPFPVMKVQ